MDRSELERLDRESLVGRAQAAGIRRARLLTRPELIDELLRLAPVDSSQLRRSRGFFGVARDLLSRIVERGLHLPDAAERLRDALDPPLPSVPRPEPEAVPTVTLAEIYAAQGHKQRAVETLTRVLEAEPEHAAARALLERIEAPEYVPPPPPLPPEAEERPDVAAAGEPAEAPPDSASPPAGREGDASASPSAEADARARDAEGTRANAAPSAPLEPERLEVEAAPPTPRVDAPEARRAPLAFAPRAAECVAVPLGDHAYYVWWRLPPAAAPPAGGRLVVRVLVLVPTWDGPLERTRDISVDPSATEIVLRDLPKRAIVRVAIGVIEGTADGGEAFRPLSHSPAIEASSTGELVEWTLTGTIPVFADDPRAAVAAAVEAAARA